MAESAITEGHKFVQHSRGLLLSVHLVMAAAAIVGVWILPSFSGLHLINHPVRTIECAMAVITPMVFLAYSPLQLHRRTRSVTWIIGYGALSIPIGAVIVVFLAIACGAPLSIEYLSRTLHWSIFMSTLSVLPAALVVGTSWPDWHRIFALARPERTVEYLICIPAHGVAIGAWLGAWVIPLDWDRPWQAWPISCTYGGVVGYLTGLFISATLTSFMSASNQLKAE